VEQKKKVEKRKKTKAPRKKAEPPPKIFPFLNLPPELRNKIYELCLLPKKDKFKFIIQKRDIRHLAVHQGPLQGGNTQRTRTNILRLNKQIHAEAASLLYSHKMYFSNHIVLQAFIGQIGPTNRELLRHLVFSDENRSPTTVQLLFAFNMLSLATNIEELHLNSYWMAFFWSSRNDSPAQAGTRMAQKLFREAVHWFDAMERSKGSPFAGLDVLKVESCLFLRSGKVRDESVPIRRDPLQTWRWHATFLSDEESENAQLKRAVVREEAFNAELKRLLTLRFKVVKP
jgi:hypothetical protein